MNYLVTIQEVLERQVEIEADSKEQAEEKAWDMYRDEEIVLDAEDHLLTDITQVIQEV